MSRKYVHIIWLRALNWRFINMVVTYSILQELDCKHQNMKNVRRGICFDSMRNVAERLSEIHIFAPSFPTTIA